MGDGSRVFFLDENGNVDTSLGYWELYKDGNIFNQAYTWVYHDHDYQQTHSSGCSRKYYSGKFTDYDADGRVDKNYWIITDDQSIEE